MLKTVCGVGSALLIIVYVLKLLRGKRRFQIRDKTVLITGASSGLGEACAHAFYDAGARVVLCARREQELERVKKDLLVKHISNPHEPVVEKMDLSQLESLPSKVSYIISNHGQVDIVINNGGISFRGEVIQTSLEVDQRLMLVNYLGQVALIKALLPSMLARNSGHIVAISSIQGKISIPFRAAYSASKHALQAFCDCLRSELSDCDVKVTLISPGYIQTNLSVNAMTHDGRAYGKMDSTTASGMAPEMVAKRVVECVEQGTNELVLAPLHHRLVVYIRALCPSLYFWIMNKRAKKQRKEMVKTN